ncbi:MAG: hypothetical protein V1802_00660 [Candidatus Aenigmatarchaeota archaeon]
MLKQMEIKKMALGELINSLFTLKDEFRGKLVDENHPRPETWDKYGGIQQYNQKILNEYEQRRKNLIAELDRREQLYKK